MNIVDFVAFLNHHADAYKKNPLDKDDLILWGAIEGAHVAGGLTLRDYQSLNGQYHEILDQRRQHFTTPNPQPKN